MVELLFILMNVIFLLMNYYTVLQNTSIPKLLKYIF